MEAALSLVSFDLPSMYLLRLLGPLHARHEGAPGIQGKTKEAARSFIVSFVHDNFNHFSFLEHLLHV